MFRNFCLTFPDIHSKNVFLFFILHCTLFNSGIGSSNLNSLHCHRRWDRPGFLLKVLHDLVPQGTWRNPWCETGDGDDGLWTEMIIPIPRLKRLFRRGAAYFRFRNGNVVVWGVCRSLNIGRFSKLTRNTGWHHKPELSFRISLTPVCVSSGTPSWFKQPFNWYRSLGGSHHNRCRRRRRHSHPQMGGTFVLEFHCTIELWLGCFSW